MVDNKLNVSEQLLLQCRTPTACWAASTQASSVDIKKLLITQHFSDFPRPTVLSFGLCFVNKDLDKLERVQRRGAKMFAEQVGWYTS